MDETNLGWMDANAVPSIRKFLEGLGEAPTIWYSVPDEKGPSTEIWYVTGLGLVRAQAFENFQRMEAELTPWADVTGIKVKASHTPRSREAARITLTIDNPNLTVPAELGTDEWGKGDPDMPFIQAILERLRSIP